MRQKGWCTYMPAKRRKKVTPLQMVLGNPLPFLIAFAVLLLIIILLIVRPWRKADTVQAEPSATPTLSSSLPVEPTEAPTDAPEPPVTSGTTEGPATEPGTASDETGATSGETGAEDPTTVSDPETPKGPTQPAGADVSNAILPKTAEGYLPVFEGIKTEEKKIAITVDDLWSKENLQAILDVCEETGAKLTFFPIGDAVKDKTDLLRAMHEAGHQIENHTYNHVNLYALSTEEMCQELLKQNQLINEALGVDYQMHFFRPRGGNSDYDKRMHNMLAQMGYAGVSHWTLSGTPEMSKWVSEVKPGTVMLFHATDKDAKKLLKAIPELVKVGYQVVTLNELYNIPANETYPLGSTTIGKIEALDLEAIENDVPIQLLKNGDTSYDVRRLQLRLKDLGYYAKDCDGEYGSGTVKAVEAFQAAAGLTVDGMAGPLTQEALFAQEAPRAAAPQNPQG